MVFSDYSTGDTGSGVSDLQTKLNSVGYSLTVDGNFGPATEAAVRDFQAKQGIAVDGIAGPQTLVALSTAIGQGWTTSGVTTANAPATTVVVGPSEASAAASSAPAAGAAASAPTAATSAAPTSSGWRAVALAAVAGAGIWWFAWRRPRRKAKGTP